MFNISNKADRAFAKQARAARSRLLSEGNNTPKDVTRIKRMTDLAQIIHRGNLGQDHILRIEYRALIATTLDRRIEKTLDELEDVQCPDKALSLFGTLEHYKFLQTQKLG